MNKQSGWIIAAILVLLFGGGVTSVLSGYWDGDTAGTGNSAQKLADMSQDDSNKSNMADGKGDGEGNNTANTTAGKTGEKPVTLFDSAADGKAQKDNETPDADNGADKAAGMETDNKEGTGSKSTGERATAAMLSLLTVDPAGTPIIAGTTFPNLKVELIDGDKVLSETNSGPSGDFSFDFTKPLAPGKHELYLKVTKADGSTLFSEKKGLISLPDPVNGGEFSVNLVKERKGPQSLDDQQMAEAKAEEEKRKAVELAKAKAEEEARKAKEMAEAKAKAEEEARKAKEMAEAKAKAEAEARKAREMAEAKAKAEEEARKAEEMAAAKAKAEAEARKAKEMAEAKAKAEEEARKAKEMAEAKAKAEEEARKAQEMAKANETSGAMAEDETRKIAQKAAKIAGERAEEKVEEETQKVALKAAKIAEDMAKEVKDQPKPDSIFVVRKGDNLWNISSRFYGVGMDYFTIFQANKDKIKNPHWIYPGQKFSIPGKMAAEDNQNNNR